MRKYFSKNDVDFSEQLASFIEEKAIYKYILKYYKKRVTNRNKLAIKKEYDQFWKIIANTKKNLNKIFKTNSYSDSKKRLLKEKQYQALLKTLKHQSKSFKLTQAANWLIKSKKINNSALAQIGRYTLKSNTFETIFQDCKQSVLCWFKQINFLKPCSNSDRKLVSQSLINYKGLLKKCNPSY